MGRLSEYSEEEQARLRGLRPGSMFPRSVVSASSDVDRRLKSIAFKDGTGVLYLTRVGDDLWSGKRFELRDGTSIAGEPENWTEDDVKDLLRREWAAQGSPLSGWSSFQRGGADRAQLRRTLSSVLALP